MIYNHGSSKKKKNKKLPSNWDFDYEVGPFTTYPGKNFKL
jgi:hypothetical protein